MKNLKNNLTAVLLVASFALLVLTQCKPENNSKKLLSQALKNKDYATAAFAYNNLLLEDSTNLDYKDFCCQARLKGLVVRRG